jgi:hypothetical protein
MNINVVLLVALLHPYQQRKQICISPREEGDLLQWWLVAVDGRAPTVDMMAVVLEALTRWNFWILSTAMDSSALRRLS